MATATRAFTEAEDTWRGIVQGQQLPAVTEVVETYPALLAAGQEQVAARRAKLGELEAKAFAKVELFRRGLPEELRAYPGIVPLQGESFSIYVKRLGRLRAGTQAVRALREADEALAKLGEDNTLAPARDDAGRALGRAADLLQPFSDPTEVQARKESVDAEWETLNSELLATQAAARDLRTERRRAAAGDFGRLDREIARRARRVRGLSRERADIALQQEQLRKQLDIAARVGQLVASLGDLQGRLKPAALAAGELAEVRHEVGKTVAVMPTIDASWRRFLVGDIPWRQWLKPTALWFLVVGLAYAVLMSFNVLIFRQWAYNERLVYPLAELPETMAGLENETSLIPPVFKSGLFWVGFAISAGFLGWNFFVATNIVPGLTALDFSNTWTPHIGGSALEGLIPNAKSTVFFTLIGVTFLIPAKISFSLWFFTLLYMVQLLVLVWCGYGVNENSFPSEWWYTLNFRTAEGGGALMVFAVVVLYKCRRYLFCSLRPASVGELELPERRELRISSFIFLFGSLGLVMILWQGLGANVYYTLLTYFVIIVITIGLVRAVAEGGILGFQAWVSPFHFIRTLVGMDKAWTSPSLFAPLMVFYSVIMLDLKTFIAPAMANAIKIRDDAGMKRGRFHLAIILALVSATVTAVGVHIMMAYSRGGDSMNGWFYTGFPRGLFNQISAMTKNTPVDNTGARLWFLFGVLLMIALLYFRQSIFWLPHPIGLIMLVNPLMRTYWFSILLGWIAKNLVTKYGNKDTYRYSRRFFIGLIFGELAIVVLAAITSYMLRISISIDLNRN